MTRRAWYAERPRECEACGRRAFVQAGHVIKEQTLRAAARSCGFDFRTARWDPRNRIWLCVRCHEPHTGASGRLSLAVLPDAAFECAAELLGPGRAYNALQREYAGTDPRLDALLARHEMALSVIVSCSNPKGRNGKWDG